MNRIKAVQRALEGRAKPLYLEIGVQSGKTFRRIAAADKVAVDPRFRLSARTKRRADALGATHYFEMTSDAFFADPPPLLGRGVDVALIDGLHTYQQVVRDVEKALRFLSDDGVIVLHDCNPRNARIGYPAASFDQFRAENAWWAQFLGWSGDVWKAIVQLRTRDDIAVSVLDCDFGVGIVRKGQPRSQLRYTPEQIKSLDYADLAADRQQLLNLVHPDSLPELLRD